MEQNENINQTSINNNNGSKCSENNFTKACGFLEKWVAFCALRVFGICKCRNEKCLQEKSRNSWLKSYGLVNSEDMTPDLREMHLLVGYRPIPSSFTYCLKSIFYPTNETVNFWTHFIAFLILFNRFYTIMHKVNGPLSDPLYYPMLVYAFGTSVMLVGSCVAHVFCSYSRGVRHTCWFCDYASIIMSFLGGSIVYHNYLCPYECMEWPIKNYVQLTGVAGVIGHAACCYSRRITSSIRYALRSSVIVFLYIGTSIPCYYKILMRTMMHFYPGHALNTSMTWDLRCNLDTENFIPVFALVTLFCFFTMFFNVSKIPERWFPGTFDILGHSHQWMHISIALAFYTQTFMIEGSLLKAEAMKKEGFLTIEDLDITWSDTIGTMSFVALSCIAISWIFSRKSTVAALKKSN